MLLKTYLQFATTTQDPRVLVLEDDGSATELIHAVLTGAGCRVMTTSSRRMAMRHFQAVPYHLVIVDLTLPDGDGTDFIRWIRRHVDRAGTPVLIASGRDTATDTAKGFEAGANGFLTKPFRPQALTEAVHHLLMEALPESESGDHDARGEARPGRAVLAH